MYDTDWLEVCLPLAGQVEQEQYTPSQEEQEAFYQTETN